MKQEAIKKEMLKDSGDGIDLVLFSKKIWEGRRTIIKTLAISILFGIFFALFTSKEYTASTTIIPQLNYGSSNLGGLSSLASLAGFNLDMGSTDSELSPILYPQIVSSTSFLLEIINEEYSFDELEYEISLEDYYLNHYKPGIIAWIKNYTIGLPGVILRAIRKDSNIDFDSANYSSEIIEINKEQLEIIIELREKLFLIVNDKEGYLTLESRFHQAALSAQVAAKAISLLQKKITDFRLEKAGAQREFINERFIEKKGEFEHAQKLLAEFRDANKNISSSVKRTEEQRLENESQLAFEVYSELAKQLEQAMIKEKEDTPVFASIKEVVLPIDYSKPNRLLILISWTILGGILGITIVQSKTVWISIKERWKDIDILK